MRDPFANYDQWLEAPYQDMMEAQDEFIDWCEANSIDPDDPEAEALFANAYNDDYDFEDYYDDEEADFEEEGW